MLQNEYLDAKIGVDTAENEPSVTNVASPQPADTSPQSRTSSKSSIFSSFGRRRSGS
jgi:hypothetical protein